MPKSREYEWTFIKLNEPSEAAIRAYNKALYEYLTKCRQPTSGNRSGEELLSSYDPLGGGDRKHGTKHERDE